MKTTYNNDEKSMIHHDNLYVFGFTLIGLIITEIPSTNAILAIFEPMTFPMAISATLSKAA